MNLKTETGRNQAIQEIEQSFIGQELTYTIK